MTLTGEQTGLIIAGVLLAIDLVVRIIAIIVVPRNRRPTAGMAWLLAIFFIPVFFVVVRRVFKGGGVRGPRPAAADSAKPPVLAKTSRTSHPADSPRTKVRLSRWSRKCPVF